ncbi:MAG TPA: hypothetical protein VLA34_12480, partial [Candidatus Krumholzibacterium sp.]|nr:hypothetical protein [Candidatus Krumholzibacterium sp.]
LPDAMINYLALLGWSLDGDREYFDRKTLIDKFSLKRISKNPAVFDMSRMEHINAEHFKKMDLGRKTMLAYRALDREGVIPADFKVNLSRPVDLKLVPGREPVENNQNGGHAKMDDMEFQRLALIINAFGNRLKLLKDIPEMLRYFYKDDFPRDEKAFLTYFKDAQHLDSLSRLADELEGLKYFDLKGVEETLRSLADRLDLDAGELIHPCRVALTGQTVSPDIFQVIVFLGKAKSVERIRAAVSEGMKKN